MKSSLIKTLQEATGISPSEESDLWAKMPESPFRKVVEYELEKRKIVEASTRRADCNYDRHQGILDGLDIAIGILGRVQK